MRDKIRAISGWLSEGLSEKEIIKKLGISKKEFDEFKKENKNFERMLAFDQNATDGELISSGIAIATGYYIYEDEAFKLKTFEEIDGKWLAVEKIEVVKVKKHVPANGSMAQFMLRNRIARYRDEKEKLDDEVLVKFEFDEDIKDYIN